MKKESHIRVRVTEDLRTRLESEAKAQGRSLSGLIVWELELALSRIERQRNVLKEVPSSAEDERYAEEIRQIRQAAVKSTRGSRLPMK